MPQNKLEIENNLLNSLKAFLGSHFLLNIVNSIQSDVVLKNEKSAFGTLQLFNRVYKSAIRLSNDQITDLGSEVSFLRDYLALEQIRFHDHRIPMLKCSISDETHVPSFVMQSMLENAILMALQDKSDKYTLQLDSSDSNQVRLTIDRERNQQEYIHPKVRPKVDLALSRLNILKANNLVDFELNWGQNHFLNLSITTH